MSSKISIRRNLNLFDWYAPLITYSYRHARSFTLECERIGLQNLRSAFEFIFGCRGAAEAIDKTGLAVKNRLCMPLNAL